MTEAEKTQLKSFEAKVRVLIEKHTASLNQIADLNNKISALQAEIARLNIELSQSKIDYNNLKTARMITITDKEQHMAKQRIINLVREVNKCINILTNGQ